MSRNALQPAELPVLLLSLATGAVQCQPHGLHGQGPAREGQEAQGRLMCLGASGDT